MRHHPKTIFPSLSLFFFLSLGPQTTQLNKTYSISFRFDDPLNGVIYVLFIQWCCHRQRCCSSYYSLSPIGCYSAGEKEHLHCFCPKWLVLLTNFQCVNKIELLHKFADRQLSGRTSSRSVIPCWEIPFMCTIATNKSFSKHQHEFRLNAFLVPRL